MLCVSLLVIVIDNTIVNVALPTLVRDLGTSISDLQWVVDAYTLVFAGLLLTAGSLGDRFGRKGALTVGLVVFGGASAAAAFSGSVTPLIGARAVMGIGAALIMPATLSILTNVFTDARERALAIGLWSGVAGIAVALGPVTGGFLLEHFWWGSVFIVNVPDRDRRDRRRQLPRADLAQSGAAEARPRGRRAVDRRTRRARSPPSSRRPATGGPTR